MRNRKRAITKPWKPAHRAGTRPHTTSRPGWTTSGALLRAYKEFEERVGTIERGRGAKGDQVRAQILQRNLPFSISEIEGLPGVGRDMVRLVLRAMKKEARSAPTGKDAEAKWIGLGQRPPTQE